MLSQHDNETLTKVGPGTPMGDLMREYWIPAMLSTELPGPDCDPVRIRLLCEDLIAFRDTNGEVGLVDNFCPHRRASLFFGRNEECGLRCVYHGWKFDVNGDCVDMPSEPEESNFKGKVKLKAYKLTERNGMLWAYMGPRQELPPLPDIEPNMMEENIVSAGLRNCNFMQALEGDIDTVHLSYLHLGKLSVEDTTPGSFDYYNQRDKRPYYKVLETDYGTMYGAYRPAEENSYYWRIAQFMMPFYTIPPEGRLGEKIGVRCWVPVDDNHTMFTSMSIRNTNSTMSRKTADGKPVAGLGGPGSVNMVPNGTGWLERWRYEPNKENDYFIDREVQREKSFTGIVGIHIQDQAITESMGYTSDRQNERLGTSDGMVIKTRQRLIKAARALQEGVPAPALDHPELYQVRSGGVILPRSSDWLEATEELRKAFRVHPEVENAAT